jgi:aminoglycoside 3-N-acetyltransferase
MADLQKNKHDFLTQADIVRGIKETGIKPGDVILVHSAMRTLGYIQGGPQTVVDALLEAVGEQGTLVVPTFTFFHEIEEDPIIDPFNDPSNTGIITETVRKHPNAFRSTAFRHSFAAIGRRARVITEVDPTLSPFDLRSSFGVMLALNTQVLLLGTAYNTSSTSHHFAEWVCDVPYRHAIAREIKMRLKDGSIVEKTMIDYQPKPSEDGLSYGSRGCNFNRLGKMLEDGNLAGVTAIGNAVARRFAMRDLIDLAQTEAKNDYNIFRTAEGKSDCPTPLDYGITVFSPLITDSAGRSCRHQWCVMDKSKLSLNNPS